MVRSVSSASVSPLSIPAWRRAETRKAPTAPGTVGMQCSRSYMRRSRLKPMTYSMCCQRPSMPLRLPTLALPAVAPTAGSANGSTRRRTVEGSKTVSASSITTISCEARSTPVLSAAALPRLGVRTTVTPGSSSASAASAVPSSDPSSTTTISTG
ncbi:hypothetical protein SALBM217S_10620 [Streptomyces griseoloalbus]